MPDAHRPGARGGRVRAVDALAGDDLHPLQRTFHEAHALQCGFCTAGFLMSIEAFLRERPAPSEQEVRKALAGNLCRCTGYRGVVEAVLSSSAEAASP